MFLLISNNLPPTFFIDWAHLNPLGKKLKHISMYFDYGILSEVSQGV